MYCPYFPFNFQLQFPLKKENNYSNESKKASFKRSGHKTSISLGLLRKSITKSKKTK